MVFYADCTAGAFGEPKGHFTPKMSCFDNFYIAYK